MDWWALGCSRLGQAAVTWRVGWGLEWGCSRGQVLLDMIFCVKAELSTRHARGAGVERWKLVDRIGLMGLSNHGALD
eukprot:4758548-Alexandrium_andersonii.AAC.1